MAAKNVPVPTVLNLPTFPQVFAKALYSQVDQIFADCSYVSPESIPSACDGGYECNDPASTVIDGQPFCSPHARRLRLLASLSKLEGESRG